MAKKTWGTKRQHDKTIKSLSIAGRDDSITQIALDNVMQELESGGRKPVNLILNKKDEVFPRSHQDAKRAKIESNEGDNVKVNSKERLKEKPLWDPSLPRHPLFGREQKDRIREWNIMFQQWVQSGSYSSGLFPSFDVEVARHFQVNELSTFLLDSCKLKIPTFERWLIDSKIEERKRRAMEDNFKSEATDVVLSRVHIQFESSQRLIEEIRESGISREEATKIVKELCRRTNVSITQIVSQTRTIGTHTSLKKGDRIELEKKGAVYTLVFHRKRWKKPFCTRLNASHYDKLHEMFLRVHNLDSKVRIRLTENGKATRALHGFHLIVMVLLIRYSSLAGGQLLLDNRGGGMQGAIHGEVFRLLLDFFPGIPLFESFASPLNAYLPSFSSAFYDDVDFHFGSVGDFLDLPITSGCCEANPPFSPGLMEIMVQRMEYNLALADENSEPLNFVIVIPKASDEGNEAPAKRFAWKAFKRLLESSYFRLHVILPAREHGYIEGSQHMRTTRYRYSLFDTSILLLQSRKAREYAFDEALFEQRARDAFLSKHQLELEQRKEGKDQSDDEDAYSL